MPQRLVGEGGLRGGMDVVEFASGMRPAEGQLWRLVSGGGDQAAKPGIAVHLEQTVEAFQMTGRMLALAIVTEDVGSGRMTGAAPLAVVDGGTAGQVATSSATLLARLARC